MNNLLRALAILLAIVAQGFMLGLSSAPSPAIGIAYLACIVLLGLAAALLWRRTLD